MILFKFHQHVVQILTKWGHVSQIGHINMGELQHKTPSTLIVIYFRSLLPTVESVVPFCR